MNADTIYQDLIETVWSHGDNVESRNGPARSLIDLEQTTFTATPLVTLRKTAWKKAIREMEWFLSGNAKCPEELRDWWQDQLNPAGDYLSGYGAQLRHFPAVPLEGWDQIQALIAGICAHPTSRRLIATTWHPWEMSLITAINGNPRTPTTCHGTVIQAFVRNGELSLKTYQRSADLLLGVPHNWIQYWALLLWLSARCGLQPGKLLWCWGDAHIYQHPTHCEAVAAILDAYTNDRPAPALEYRGDALDGFHADDFAMTGVIPRPVTTIRPALL